MNPRLPHRVRLAATLAAVLAASLAASPAARAEGLDLSAASVAIRADASDLERVASRVLIEEIALRAGVELREGESPGAGPRVSIEVAPAGSSEFADLRAEGYALLASPPPAGSSAPAVRIVGADARGALFGVGRLLRELELRPAKDGAPAVVRLRGPLAIRTSPAYPIRGHQLGYRNRANSWDAWTREQFDRHIRELAFFGNNAIENIPFQDESVAPHMKFSREELNRVMSEICAKYGQDYWVWTPADFDLNDAALRADAIAKHERLYADCPRLDGVFFPGGDPGDNDVDLVLPFLEDLAPRLAARHPNAGIWISLQGFDRDNVERFYKHVEERRPKWLAGVVCGPSSPSIASTRARLPREYKLRHYPDITHTVRCQYPVPWWDPAFARTLGRECVNPRPVAQATIHNAFAPYTDGFVSYSDGVHDDVNKIVWNAMAWDPESDVREVLIQYGRVFMGHEGLPPEAVADALLALERNWVGPAAENGAIPIVADGIAAFGDAGRDNWRWQMVELRAYYDAFVRARLLRETRLEDEANAVLARAAEIGAEAAMGRAEAILATPLDDRLARAREAVVEVCERLHKSIALQTSVPKYAASAAERGAVLDFLDVPLNDRWWIEDEFAEIRALGSEVEKVARLLRIATWEDPGPGGFYDDVGNVAASPRVVRGETIETQPDLERVSLPDVMWWDEGLSRERLSWQSYMMWPYGMRYRALDPAASYVVRTTGYGQCLLKIDDERVEPTIDGRGIGEMKEFPVPAAALADGELHLTFARPFEPGVNWRQQSRLTEVWLLKR